jgi:hypothetical protein
LILIGPLFNRSGLFHSLMMFNILKSFIAATEVAFTGATTAVPVFTRVTTPAAAAAAAGTTSIPVTDMRYTISINTYPAITSWTVGTDTGNLLAFGAVPEAGVFLAGQKVVEFGLVLFEQNIEFGLQYIVAKVFSLNAG